MDEAQKIAKIGSWSFDVKSGKIDWSKQLFSIFSLDYRGNTPTFEEHINQLYFDDRKMFVSTVQKIIQDGIPYRFRYRKSDFEKTNVWLEAIGSAIKDVEGNVSVLHGTCQDITDLVEAEEKTKMERAKSIHTAKLASLGEMSAGVAHEINNPLAIISGNAALLPKIIGNPEKIENCINAIQKASGRIVKIVNGLRKFSRTSEQSELSKNSLHHIIHEAINMTDSKVKREFVVLSYEHSSEPNVICNEIEIEQVLVNLISNAVDAIKKNDDKWIQIKLFEIGQQVVVQVRDSGKGIPKEVARNLFQPFFTTKAVGEGTGLGLSITKGILDQHGATIEVLNNDPNTCFEIRIKKAE